jgi:alkyl sulfatase BDS1-like metallo-beta-lactamase superfamily hydrolase
VGDLLALSSRIIDSGVVDEPVNRITNELSELADDLAIVESFSHCVVLRTGDGLVAFDASGVATGAAVVEAIQTWDRSPVTTLVYTHGHADHVGGSRDFAAAYERPPTVVAHENVPRRLDRYELTNDWNVLINARQFGGIRGDMGYGIGGGGRRFLPRDTLRPDVTFTTHHELDVGGEHVELHHARGETDDHLWAWLPDRRWLMAGDFVIWNFPNAGNPQKVQRYPAEWAAALRRMIEQRPELLVPAHGLPIEGAERIAAVLDDIATALEALVAEVLAMMNGGATLDEIVHSVTVPADVLARPHLRPLYDEPEFVVRNVWRQFGGWWDGAASRLKPSPDAHVARAVAELAGGVGPIVATARSAATGGDLRLACHLADLAAWALDDDAPERRDVHTARAEIYRARRNAETSLMSKGIFAAAARESEREFEEERDGAS